MVLGACESSLERIEDWDSTAAPTVPADIRGLHAPEGFDFATTRAVELEIAAAGLTGPAAQVGLSVWTEGSDGTAREIGRGATGRDGAWRTSVALPRDRDSVTLRVHSSGYASLHRIAVADLRTTRYTLGGENANGRPVAEPISAEPVVTDTLGARLGGSLTARSAFLYQGAYDAQGVPKTLTTPSKLGDLARVFINEALPEHSALTNNPEYFDSKYSSSIEFRTAGELWLSMAHEGAGYRNAIGYFLYSLAAPPRRVRDIAARTIVFPNFSFAGSGGGLKVGDRVYLGHIPAGTGVCVFLVPNGWDGKVVKDKPNVHYTIDDLNREFAKRADSRHAVLLSDAVNRFAILGFEDVARPGGDHDFNDAVLVVEAEPWSALALERTVPITIAPPDTDGDGVEDRVDLYPTDAARAFAAYAPSDSTFGSVAFEDMWPRISDYDFNDLVVDYNVTEVLSPLGLVKDLAIDLRVRALGGSQNHGLAFQLPVPAAQVASVTGQRLDENTYVTLAPNGTEQGTSQAVVPAFTSGLAFFGTRRGETVNTDPLLPRLEPGVMRLVITFAQPVPKSVLGAAPYDIFMLRSQDRSREIHLAGYGPTERADRTTFGTEADASDPATGKYYVDKNNLPWAIHVPEQFLYPEERRRIDEVYLDFTTWATYGGTTLGSWFRPGTGAIDGGPAF